MAPSKKKAPTDDPRAWHRDGNALFYSACLLRDAFCLHRQDRTDQAGDLKAAIGKAQGHLGRHAILFLGYAFENLIKSFVVPGKDLKEKKKRRNHELADLFEAAGVAVEADEKALLDQLEEYIKWKGRYRADKIEKDYTCGLPESDVKMIFGIDLSAGHWSTEVESLKEKLDGRFQALAHK